MRRTPEAALFLALLAAGCAKPSPPGSKPPPPEQAAADPVPEARPLPSLIPGQKPPAPEPPKAEPAKPREPDPTIGSTAAAPVESAPGGRPKLSAVWEFGTLAPGAEARHRFTIANNSAAPWTIKFVTKSCTCAAGDFSRQQVKPGETTWLEVTLRAPAAEGPLQQSVVVDFAEPGAPTAFLILKGEVRQTFAAVPASLDLGRVSSGASPGRAIELHNRGGQDVTIAKVEAPDWLHVELAPLKKDGTRQAWKATLRADAAKVKPGRATASVVVRTDSDQVGPLTIPVSVERKAPLEAVPDSLNFETVETGESATRSAVLEADAALGELVEKDFAVTHDLGDELQVRVAATGRPGRFLLTAEFRPVRSKGPVRGKVDIRVQQEGVPPVALKVFAEVR